MSVSAYERRKFVRVEINLDARINREIRAAVKKLSLGGCLVECNRPLAESDLIHLTFSTFDQKFHLPGRVIHTAGPNRYGVRFEPESDDQVMRLVDVIQKIQDASVSRRSTRVKVQREALLDKEPSLLMNLSEGGCSLRTSQPFHPGDIVEVQFFLNDEEIHLAGQVRWTASEGVGVEFLSPDPIQMEDISRFLTKQGSRSPKAS